MKFQLARYKNMSANLSEYENLFKQYSSEVVSSNYFIEGDKPTIAAANLRAYLRQVVGKAGGQLTSTQDLPSDADSEGLSVSLKVSVTGDVNQLSKVFLMLENEKPLLLLDDIQVVTNVRRVKATVTKTKKMQRQVAKPVQTISHLMVRFNLTGFLMPEGV